MEVLHKGLCEREGEGMFEQMKGQLEDMQKRYQELEKLLGDRSAPSRREERIGLMKEFSSLGKTVTMYKEYQEIQKNIHACENMLSSTKEDQEMKILAQEELKLLNTKKDTLLQELKTALIPQDPLDEKNVIMEIRPAAGGDEASLFCASLFSMYSHYADQNNWKQEIISSSKSHLGGFKEIIFSVSGSAVYGRLKYESGVHRVQRVPKTETQGRVHTSTVTVVVLPSVDAKAVRIRSSDLRMDTFRSRGAGGQHVNTTDSAIRVVHLPTKITVQCQDEKSQHANKEKALKVLYARLYDYEMEKQKKEESQSRLAQIGTGDRSEKIRTYNFPQSRVTDHRIQLTLYNLEQIMAGELNPLITALKQKEQETLLKDSPPE